MRFHRDEVTPRVTHELETHWLPKADSNESRTSRSNVLSLLLPRTKIPLRLLAGKIQPEQPAQGKGPCGFEPSGQDGGHAGPRPGPALPAEPRAPAQQARDVPLTICLAFNRKRWPSMPITGEE